MVRIRLKRVGNRNRPIFRVVVTDSRSPRDYLTLEGAYRLALSTLSPRLRSLPGVYLKTSADPACAYLDRAAERFQDAYYGNGTMDFGAGRELPDLLIDEPAAGSDVATLDLAFTVPRQPADTLDILASLRAKGRLLSRQRYSVAAETDELEACRVEPEVADGPPTSGGDGEPVETAGLSVDDTAPPAAPMWSE